MAGNPICVQVLYQTVVDSLGQHPIKNKSKLDPVGSTVRYEMMKLCTGSVIGYYEAVAVGNW